MRIVLAGIKLAGSLYSVNVLVVVTGGGEENASGADTRNGIAHPGGPVRLLSISTLG